MGQPPPSSGTGLARRRFLGLGRANPAPVAVDAMRCLAHQGVVCRACGDACDDRAIRFAPVPGRTATPAIDAAACTRCGACVAACPVRALALEPAHG